MKWFNVPGKRVSGDSGVGEISRGAPSLQQRGQHRRREQQDQVTPGAHRRAFAERDQGPAMRLLLIQPYFRKEPVGVGQAFAVTMKERREDDNPDVRRHRAGFPFGRRNALAQNQRGGGPEPQ